MSFLKSLKGLADDFKDLMGDKDKDKEKEKKQAEQQKPVGGILFRQVPCFNVAKISRWRHRSRSF